MLVVYSLMLTESWATPGVPFVAHALRTEVGEGIVFVAFSES